MSRQLLPNIFIFWQTLVYILIGSTLYGLQGCDKKSNLKTPRQISTIFNMVEESSIYFSRGPDQKTGIFSFSIKENHECRVEYWSTDPNVTPNSSAPLAIDCPEGESQIRITVTRLSPEAAYKFKVYAWKSNEDIGNAQTFIFSESPRTTELNTSDVLVLLHDTPSRANQLHGYRYNNEISTKIIEEDFKNRFDLGQSGSNCYSSVDTDITPFLDPSGSAEQTVGQILNKISEVSSAGYGNGRMRNHPYYSNRLIQEYINGVEDQLTWVWKFRWDNKPFSISAWPPSYWRIDSLTVEVNNRNYIQQNRDLEATVPPISVGSTSPIFTMKYKQAYLGLIHMHFRSINSDKTELHCVFSANSDTFSIPTQHWNTLNNGTFDVLASYEVAQLRFNQTDTFPPWLVITKDWIYFKMEKRFQ